MRQRAQQNLVAFAGNQIADAENSAGNTMDWPRGKQVSIDTVVNDPHIQWGRSIIDDFVGNLVADTNDTRCRSINRLSNPLAAGAEVSANLIVKECVKTVDGDDKRNFQFPAQ